MIGVSVQGDQEGAPLDLNQDVYAPQQGERGAEGETQTERMGHCETLNIGAAHTAPLLPLSLKLSPALWTTFPMLLSTQGNGSI